MGRGLFLLCILNLVSGTGYAIQIQEAKIYCGSLNNSLPSFPNNQDILIKGEVKIISCEGKPVKIFSIDKSENSFYDALGKLINSCQSSTSPTQTDNNQYEPIPIDKEGNFLSSFAIENTYIKDKFLLFSSINCN